MVAMQTAANLRARDIASGFDYLSRAAGFEIAQGGLSYSSRDTYARALEVGLVNTLRVAAIGIAVASALGLLVGVARLSPIWIVSATSRVYVEVLRKHAAAAAAAVLVFAVAGACREPTTPSIRCRASF